MTPRDRRFALWRVRRFPAYWFDESDLRSTPADEVADYVPEPVRNQTGWLNHEPAQEAWKQ